MDEARFDELFQDIFRWVYQARRLNIAADRFTQPTVAALTLAFADEAGREAQSPTFLNLMEDFRALSDARALLFGLAIENACKARLIRSGGIVVDGGRVKGLRLDHDLLAMVRDAQYSPSSEENEFVRLLAYQVRVLAKYPIAKDLKAQNQFTGRAVGARPEESEVVRKIVVGVLKDRDLVDAFLLGYTDKPKVA